MLPNVEQQIFKNQGESTLGWNKNQCESTLGWNKNQGESTLGWNKNNISSWKSIIE